LDVSEYEEQELTSFQIKNWESRVLKKIRKHKTQNGCVTHFNAILYYDWPEQANHIAFKIVSESGAEILPGHLVISTDGSYNRYPSIDLKTEKYYLVPFESSDNPHAKNPGKVEEQSILVNP
jgi:hypothetical protein